VGDSAQSCDRRLGRSVGAITQHIARQSIPERAELGGRREQRAQAVAAGQHELDAKARVLAPVVIGPRVVHAPVRGRERLLALDERVAELVEDHLREAVVRVERLVVPDRERAAAVSRGVRIRRADHPEPDPACGTDPHLRKWIDVPICDLSRHGLFSAFS
jgi:hypothetical protein